MTIPSFAAVGLGLSLAMLSPVNAAAERWQPKPGTSWQIQYSGKLRTGLNVAAFDLDLFETSAEVIDALHRSGKKVICYFSAGSFENWRPDVQRFPAVAKGRPLEGWPGERWLDVRRLDVLMPIMEARIGLASAKGCDAVDPDNVDGYTNRTGFDLSAADQLRYNIALAVSAHAAGLAIGLKNDLDQVADLVGNFDFAVNEECFSYGECDRLLPFIAAGKAVFGVEYRLPRRAFCPAARQMNVDFLRKRLSLGAWRKACR